MLANHLLRSAGYAVVLAVFLIDAPDRWNAAAVVVFLLLLFATLFSFAVFLLAAVEWSYRNR